jgi:hypothetical protein
MVVTVWQPTHGLGSFAWAGATASMVDFFKLDRAAAEDARNVCHDGVRIGGSGNGWRRVQLLAGAALALLAIGLLVAKLTG